MLFLLFMSAVCTSLNSFKKTKDAIYFGSLNGIFPFGTLNADNIMSIYEREKEDVVLKLMCAIGNTNRLVIFDAKLSAD